MPNGSGCGGPRPTAGRRVLTVLAVVLASVAIWSWPASSATARVVPRSGPASARLATSVHSRLTSRREVRRREREAVALVRALAAELRSGAPESAALTAASEAVARSASSNGSPRARSPAAALSAVLAPAAAAVARGASLPAELGRLATQPGAGRLLPVAAVWTAAERHGAPVTALLDRLADAYDDEDAVRTELTASVAGSRASMLVLAALPAGGVLLGAAVGGHPWTWLFGRPLGWATCVVAAGLDAAGVGWTRWLLRERP
jgi:tight adherence protein B